MTSPPPPDTVHDTGDRRNVLLSELRWAAVAAFVLASLVGVIVVTSYRHMLHPPSPMERTDGAVLHLSGEFVERNLGTQELPDGRIVARVVATRFAFVPDCLPIPAGRPFTLRVATPDVLHGLIVDRTNVNTMIVPGEVSEVRSTLSAPGVYHMPCHEYCGLGHSEMIGHLLAVDPRDWRPALPTARLHCTTRPGTETVIDTAVSTP